MTPPNNSDKKTPVKFHWSYVAVPVMVLAAALLLTAYFYAKLPAQIAYHFKGDGTPDRSMGRSQIIFILMLPQIVLTLVAAGTTFGMILFSSRFHQIITGINLGKIIALMGNIVSLPQIVLFFFMLDVFLYNVYESHFLTLWVLGAIVMTAGGIILGIYFTKTLREARRTIH